MNLKEINEEVFYLRDAITKVNHKDIEFLKNKATDNKRKRVRACSHKGVEDSLHEMLIVHAKGAYIRPHKHINKIESFHMIEGRLKVVIFNETGEILEVINMGDYDSGETFYYRLSESYFHTVVPISDFVVFHETTNGPFRRSDMVFASWSPAEDEFEKQKDYLKELTAELARKV